MYVEIYMLTDLLINFIFIILPNLLNISLIFIYKKQWQYFGRDILTSNSVYINNYSTYLSFPQILIRHSIIKLNNVTLPIYILFQIYIQPTEVHIHTCEKLLLNIF